MNDPTFVNKIVNVRKSIAKLNLCQHRILQGCPTKLLFFIWFARSSKRIPDSILKPFPYLEIFLHYANTLCLNIDVFFFLFFCYKRKLVCIRCSYRKVTRSFPALCWQPILAWKKTDLFISGPIILTLTFAQMEVPALYNVENSFDSNVRNLNTFEYIFVSQP